MEGKTLARLGAIIFVAIAITAAAIEMVRQDDPPVRERVRALEPAQDPLRDGQRRCQQLGEAAANDRGCLRVWAETRDRFLGRPQQPASPHPIEGR